MKSKAAVRRIVEALKALYPDAARSNIKRTTSFCSPCAFPPSAPTRVNMVTPSLYQVPDA